MGRNLSDFLRQSMGKAIEGLVCNNMPASRKHPGKGGKEMEVFFKKRFYAVIEDFVNIPILYWEKHLNEERKTQKEKVEIFKQKKK